MIETCKLPFDFDRAKLQADLARFNETDWQPHFNQSYYVGDWSGIALRAAKDSLVELYPDPVSTGFVDTDKLRSCSYIPRVLDAFECELETVRFLRLGPGAEIREHRDYRLGVEDGVARIHIPVVTNPHVIFHLNHKQVRMDEGEAWYLNFNLPHSVLNKGEAGRVHLVIDCIANDWLRDQINSVRTLN